MAKFRNVSGELRRVGYGCPVTSVAPDEVLTVVNQAAIAYAGQPTIWHAEDKAAQDAEDEFWAAVTMFHPVPGVIVGDGEPEVVVAVPTADDEVAEG